jgi:histone-lysine N-methyltransferase SETD3
VILKVIKIKYVFFFCVEHLETWLSRDNCHDLEHTDCALDTDLETRVWAFLSTRLSILLRSYPSTLEVNIFFCINIILYE